MRVTEGEGGMSPVDGPVTGAREAVLTPGSSTRQRGSTPRRAIEARMQGFATSGGVVKGEQPDVPATCLVLDRYAAAKHSNPDPVSSDGRGDFSTSTHGGEQC